MSPDPSLQAEAKDDIRDEAQEAGRETCENRKGVKAIARFTLVASIFS